MTDWTTWKKINEQKIEHPYGYEKQFVEQILQHIKNISPSDVYAQFHFKDSSNKNRYIDFYIWNEQKGYCLPIELDGAAKDTNQHAWADFLARQNDLLAVFGPLLRFSNQQMFNSKDAVINAINSKLLEQMKQKSALEQSNVEHQALLKNLKANEKELARLASVLAGKNITVDVYQQQMTELAKLNESLEIQLNSLSIKMKDNFKKRLETARNENNQEIKIISDENKFMNKALAIIATIAVSALVFTSIKSSQVPVAQIQNSTNKSAYISSLEAKDHVGSQQKVCGEIVQIKQFGKGVYLNFDNRFPRNDFSVVVWKSKLAEFKQNNTNLSSLRGEQVCVTGKITNYKGKQQIKLSNISDLSSKEV